MKDIHDFNSITPCGEYCNGCNHKKEGTCTGCRENDGRCVKMWSNGCEIYKCCLDHKVHFCGLCNEFPCQWLTEKITAWNPNGVNNLRKLAEEFNISH